MRGRQVGPVRVQGWPVRVVDAQAGQRMGCARFHQRAPEARLSLPFVTMPAEAGAALLPAKSQGGKREACEGGFTMVELLIVVGIIMTLAALAIPSYSAARDAARYTKAVGDINTLETDIFTYLGSNGVLPNSLTDIGRGDLLDPWGHPYVYTNYADASKKNQERKDRFLHPLNSDYDLFSAGADGLWKPPLTAAESHDDIIRANDGAYVGLASQY